MIKVKPESAVSACGEESSVSRYGKLSTMDLPPNILCRAFEARDTGNFQQDRAAIPKISADSERQKHDCRGDSSPAPPYGRWHFAALGHRLKAAHHEHTNEGCGDRGRERQSCLPVFGLRFNQVEFHRKKVNACK